MTKVKRVLIALDFDPTAQKVAEFGYNMANAMNAEISLLHVIADSAYYSSMDYSPIVGFLGFNEIDFSKFSKVGELKSATQNYLDKVKQKLGDEKIKTCIREGDFAHGILDEAKKTHADFIVMGSHSRSWLSEILMGSVTEKVLRSTKVPLLIIPIKK